MADANVEIFLYTSCTSCRNAEGLLKELGVEAERRDYFRQRFSREELATLLKRIGMNPSEVLSTRSTPYKSLNLASKSLTEDELLDLMVEHPQLLRRPLVVRGSEATVGFSRGEITALVEGD